MSSQPPRTPQNILVGRVRRWCPGTDGEGGWGSVFSELHNRDIFFDADVVSGGAEDLEGALVLFQLLESPRLAISKLWHPSVEEVLRQQEANQNLYREHAVREGPSNTFLAGSQERSQPSRDARSRRHQGQSNRGQYPLQAGAVNGTVVGSPSQPPSRPPTLGEVDGYAQQQQQQMQGMYAYTMQQAPYQQGAVWPGQMQPATPSSVPAAPAAAVQPSRPQVAVLVECPKLLSDGWKEDHRKAAHDVVSLLLQPDPKAALQGIAKTVQMTGCFHASGTSFAQQLRQQYEQHQQQQAQQQQYKQMQQQMVQPQYMSPDMYWWQQQQWAASAGQMVSPAQHHQAHHQAQQQASQMLATQPTFSYGSPAANG